MRGRWEAAASTRHHADLLRWLSAGWLLLILGRYVDVTAPALWGRELNFYWDLRFLPDVAAMLVGASRNAALLGTMVAAVVVLVLWALYLAVRWAFRQTLGALAEPSSRRVLVSLAIVGIALFAIQAAGLLGRDYLGNARRLFPKPVTQVYARQARLIVQAMSDGTHLAPSPALDANLERVQGADVFLFFIESYGAVAFERPEFNTRLQQPRALFDRAIHDTGRDVVSAFVESPTFGGSSWFAHISFLSGIKVGDPDTNALLMTEQRPTVVTNFARRGYRTLAMMPGLWYPWPEGAFYGFQDIYNGPKLDYQGPSFGWWDMPDQFTLAKLDEQEVSKRGASAAVRVLPDGQHAHAVQPAGSVSAGLGEDADAAALHRRGTRRSVCRRPRLHESGPGLLPMLWRTRTRRSQDICASAPAHDYVMILIGDHQPPALVSGEGAPWDVPIHVITNRPDDSRQSGAARLRARTHAAAAPPRRDARSRSHPARCVQQQWAELKSGSRLSPLGSWSGDGRWAMGDGRWAMGDGRWAMGDGRWAMK